MCLFLASCATTGNNDPETEPQVVAAAQEDLPKGSGESIDEHLFVRDPIEPVTPPPVEVCSQQRSPVVSLFVQKCPRSGMCAVYTTVTIICHLTPPTIALIFPTLDICCKYIIYIFPFSIGVF